MMVIAQNVQDMIDNCLQYHAQYLGQGNTAGSSTVNRDFVGARLEPADIKELRELYTAQVIGKETLLKELADGEVFSDDFDVDSEMEANDGEDIDIPAA